MAEWFETVYGFGVAGLAKAGWALLLAGVSMLFGFDYLPVQSLVALMGIDLALGSARAVGRVGNSSDFNGKRFIRRGLGKFVVYGIAMQVAMHTDAAIGLGDHALLTFRFYLCSFLAVHEALSALTHLEAFGFPLLKGAFKVWLVKYRESLEGSRKRVSDNHMEADRERL